MTAADASLIGEAVYQNRRLSWDTLLERLFARLFRGLVYPQIWEDPLCDMVALDLANEDDIVCIASGGCNMMSYLTAEPASITAVDLSPWHVELGKLKLASAAHLPDHAAFYSVFGNADARENVDLLDTYVLPTLSEESLAFWNARNPLRRRKSLFARGFYNYGVLGRFLGLVHLVTGIARVDYNRLLKATSLDQQKAFFQEELEPLFDSRLIKFAARRRASLFGLGIPPAQHDKLSADAGGDIIPVLKERARKLFCDFPIGETYFAWQAASCGYKPEGDGPVPPYLETSNFGKVCKMADRATVLNRSITDILSEAPSRSKSVYILLDAQDWMNDHQLMSLWKQITRTARPGARVLFRTGGAPDILPGRVPASLLDRWIYDAEASKRAFETDRSAIYGGVHLYRFEG